MVRTFIMGQAYPFERCTCGTLMVLVPPTGRKGPRVLRCVNCDEIDPLKLPTNLAWIDGELRSPK